MPQELMDYWKDATNAQMQAFMNAAPVLMHATDPNGRIIAVSDYWARFLGYQPSDMIEMSMLEMLTPQSKAMAIEEMLPDLKEHGENHNVEIDFLRSDGELAPVLMSARRIFDENGKHTTTLSVFFDNRAAKEAQKNLEETARAAEDANRAKSRFLAAMSHEIRTPMNAILGFAQLLKLSNLDERRKRHVDAILNAGGSLMDLLTDLLDLNQIEEGAMRIETRPFDLYSLIDQIADWWYSSAQNKRLSLLVQIDPDLPRDVISDPVRIQQVLNNLLGNAVKFTTEGHVTLDVRVVSRTDESCRVRFEVKDTGPGMRSDQIERLFRPFVQIDTDFSKESGGWGLGLSICANIAQHLDADLGAESEPGHGATFHFELDLEVAHAIDSIVEPVKLPEKKRAKVSLRILIAEDNILNQDMLSELLESLGHDVSVATDGFEAIEAAQRSDFDLILMDIMMPGLDGIKATEQIRSGNGRNSTAPIVACSAHIAEDTQRRFKEAGMTDFLAKPIDAIALTSLLDRITADGLSTTSVS